MQLDAAERGFSFRLDGPLDMRMGGGKPNAADVVAAASERELAAIIATLGEERHARAVARAIVAARGRAPITTTRALAEILERVVRGRPGAIHPATRTFQALRMFVNDELAELAAGLRAAEQVLRPGGRLVVVAFHSLEDRIVKSFLVERSRIAAGSRHRPATTPPPPTFGLLTKRPIVPDEAEIAANPRARSAKLRAGERSDAAPVASRSAGLLPRLPALADFCEEPSMMRLLNILVIAALVFAAAHVYKIKFEIDPAGTAGGATASGDQARERRHCGVAGGVVAARQSGAHPGADAPASCVEADRGLAVRFPRPVAAAAA